MPDQVVAGVDVGSSSARAVAIDRSGSVVASSIAGYPLSDLPQGEVEPSVWLDGAVTALAELGVTPAAICVGGQSPTTVAHGGELAITFRHVHGAALPPDDQHGAHTELLRDRYGSDVRPRLLWDWVNERLGARDDVQSLWPGNDALPDFGEPIPTGGVVGSTDGSHGLPEGVALVAGSNDAFLTSWGSGIDQPGKAFDPGGTTGGYAVAIDGSEHPEKTQFGMPCHVSGVYAVGGPVAAHGAMLDWWSRVTSRTPEQLLEMAEAVPPGSFGVMALPFLEGERAPRWNPALRAELIGMHLDHDAGVVARAIVEATAYGIGHIARDLAAEGIRAQRVVCSGGPSRSRFWMEVKAAVLEVPVDVPVFHHMASYGAALGAGASLGWWPRPGTGAAGDWPLPERYSIEPAPLDVYREGLERFIALGDAAEKRLEG